jgi:hypothetical protein
VLTSNWTGRQIVAGDRSHNPSIELAIEFDGQVRRYCGQIPTKQFRTARKIGVLACICNHKHFDDLKLGSNTSVTSVEKAIPNFWVCGGSAGLRNSNGVQTEFRMEPDADSRPKSPAKMFTR